MPVDLEQTITELRMEHARLDRVIKQLEQLPNAPSPYGERPRIVVRRRGRPPGSKNRRRNVVVLQEP